MSATGTVTKTLCGTSLQICRALRSVPVRPQPPRAAALHGTQREDHRASPNRPQNGKSQSWIGRGRSSSVTSLDFPFQVSVTYRALLAGLAQAMLLGVAAAMTKAAEDAVPVIAHPRAARFLGVLGGLAPAAAAASGLLAGVAVAEAASSPYVYGAYAPLYGYGYGLPLAPVFPYPLMLR